jgi:hypothetical protein
LALNCVIYRHSEPLAVYHMEDSELGISARKKHLPLEPVFTNIESLRRGCPPGLRGKFDLWLGRHAIRTCFLQLDRGDAATAAWLLRTFRSEIALWPEAWKLRCRLRHPEVWRAAMRVKRVLMNPFKGNTQRSCGSARNS